MSLSKLFVSPLLPITKCNAEGNYTRYKRISHFGFHVIRMLNEYIHDY